MSFSAAGGGGDAGGEGGVGGVGGVGGGTPAPFSGYGASGYSVNEDGWPLSPDGYELLEEVGQGAFAKVVRARCPTLDKEGVPCEVAVKIMKLENISTSMEEIQSEVRAMRLNRNENVLNLFCCFVVKSDLWLVMPHMDRGSCYHVLRALRKAGKLPEGHGLPEEVVATIVREILQGLAYIHAQGQIHRDIKAGNVSCLFDLRRAVRARARARVPCRQRARVLASARVRRRRTHARAVARTEI